MKKEKRRSNSKLVGGSQLAVINPRVAGIDIGSREMFVCGSANREGRREVRVFATTTQQILECVRWLKEQNVESAALESTGVYWIPVLEILESQGVSTLLVDPGPLSRVPGRSEKTDSSDCQWIQTLHSHGLLNGSFRPSEPVGELRTIVRQKTTLMREQGDWIRRMQKCLDQMNVRVHHAVTQTQGATGMAILRAIVAGERDARKLAALRDPGCQKSETEMVELLTGHWRADHLFNLKQHMMMYDTVSSQLAVYEQEIQRRMQELTPSGRKETEVPAVAKPAKQRTIKRRGQEARRQALYRMIGADLTSIDGIGVETAEVIISEYGIDMSKFPSEKEFAKHVGLVPSRPVSGGKVLKKKARKARKSTRTADVLRNAASALKNSHSAIGSYFRRIARRIDAGVAVFATARKLAEMVYRMLRYGQAYVDQGQAAYEKQYEATRLRAIKSTAKQLGYDLVKQEAATA